MTHVIKLVHTHTKKKNDKIILLKGRKYVIIVFIPIDINQYFANTHTKKHKASAVREGPWSGSFKSVR